MNTEYKSPNFKELIKQRPDIDKYLETGSLVIKNDGSTDDDKMLLNIDFIFKSGTRVTISGDNVREVHFAAIQFLNTKPYDNSSI